MTMPHLTFTHLLQASLMLAISTILLYRPEAKTLLSREKGQYITHYLSIFQA